MLLLIYYIINSYNKFTLYVCRIFELKSLNIQTYRNLNFSKKYNGNHSMT